MNWSKAESYEVNLLEALLKYILSLANIEKIRWFTEPISWELGEKSVDYEIRKAWEKKITD